MYSLFLDLRQGLTMQPSLLIYIKIASTCDDLPVSAFQGWHSWGRGMPYLAHSLFLISVRRSLHAMTLDDMMTFVILTCICGVGEDNLFYA